MPAPTPCPPAEAIDREAARVVACFPEQGWSLLCNGVIVFEDTGELLPDGTHDRAAPRPAPATRPVRSPRRRTPPQHSAPSPRRARRAQSPRRVSSNASGGGHAQTRFRSPYAPSMRRTGGQYFAVPVHPGRVRRHRPRVRVRPLVRRHHRRRVRRVRQRVVALPATPPAPPGRSPPGSRSSRRRTGPARPGPRSRSAPPSACRPPGTTSSARGSRSRSAASPRRRRVTPVALVIGRRSRMHSCATRPLLPAYSTG